MASTKIRIRKKIARRKIKSVTKIKKRRRKKTRRKIKIKSEKNCRISTNTGESSKTMHPTSRAGHICSNTWTARWVSLYIANWWWVYNSIFKFSLMLRRHAKPTTHSCRITPTVMAIGASMRTTRSARASRQTVIRWVPNTILCN